jgi:hypothetical protein
MMLPGSASARRVGVINAIELMAKLPAELGDSIAEVNARLV